MQAEERLQASDIYWEREEERSLPNIPQVTLFEEFLCISCGYSNLHVEILDLFGMSVVHPIDITLSAGESYPIYIGELPVGEYLLILREGSKYAIYSFTK